MKAEKIVTIDKKERKIRIATKREERKVLVSKTHNKGPSKRSTCSTQSCHRLKNSQHKSSKVSKSSQNERKDQD